MKAMILAAGLGTRLRPLTDTMPKALVKYEEKTLLEHALDHLKAYGIREVIINVHHFAGMIEDFLEENHNFGLDIILSDETGELLDTGGGVKKAGWFFSDGQPFLVRNADVISDLDLFRLEAYHREHRPLATLVVRERATSRYFLFDEKNQLSGWTNIARGEERITRESAGSLKKYAFSGIHVIDPLLLKKITEEGKFSLTDMYLRMSSHENIIGYLDNSSTWKDAGKP
jgi:NDP-sugar pyrophosphorylase family protein